MEVQLTDQLEVQLKAKPMLVIMPLTAISKLHVTVLVVLAFAIVNIVVTSHVIITQHVVNMFQNILTKSVAVLCLSIIKSAAADMFLSTTTKLVANKFPSITAHVIAPIVQNTHVSVIANMCLNTTTSVSTAQLLQLTPNHAHNHVKVADADMAVADMAADINLPQLAVIKKSILQKIGGVIYLSFFIASPLSIFLHKGNTD